MSRKVHAACRRGHLSRHERLKLARTEAFSRRTNTHSLDLPPVKLRGSELEVIDRLARRDRTAVSSALLAIAGIGAGEPTRRAVLASVSEAAHRVQAEGAIRERRSAQIARHVKLAGRAERCQPELEPRGVSNEGRQTGHSRRQRAELYTSPGARWPQ